MKRISKVKMLDDYQMSEGIIGVRMENGLRIGVDLSLCQQRPVIGEVVEMDMGESGNFVVCTRIGGRIYYLS